MKIMYKQYRDVVNFDTLKCGDLFKWCNRLYVKCETYFNMNAIRMEDGRQDCFTQSHGVIPIEGTFVEE